MKAIELVESILEFAEESESQEQMFYLEQSLRKLTKAVITKRMLTEETHDGWIEYQKSNFEKNKVKTLESIEEWRLHGE